LKPAKPAAVKPASAEAAKPGAETPLMRVHFLDVGQGAATLIELPCGAMLVDTGGEDDDKFHSNDALTEYLTAFFARRKDLGGTLDLLLLTHPHIDHVRGAPMVLDKWKVRNLVDDGKPGTSPEEAVEAVSQVHAFAADHLDGHYVAVRTDELPADNSPLTGPVIDPFPSCKGVDPQVGVLWGAVPTDPGWGTDDYNHDRFSNENNHSVVTRVAFGKASLLITGDLEEIAIKDLLARGSPALDADIYEVGHHGSANGTTPELLAAVSPAWAVAEVGPNERHASWTAWQYGHPRVTTIEKLEAGLSGHADPRTVAAATGTRTFTTMAIDREIFATGWDGSVVLEADAAGNIRRGTPDVVHPPAAAP
jgi:beta-lactamase superfamily II metal-dependent hydrolase